MAKDSKLEVNWLSCPYPKGCRKRAPGCPNGYDWIDKKIWPALVRDIRVQDSHPYCKDNFCMQVCPEAGIFHYRSGGGWRQGQAGLHEMRVNLFDSAWLRTLLGEEKAMNELERFRSTVFLSTPRNL